jgi:8-oxo-dGTP pyrophosphatase MutT (NUDIX family)
MYVSNVTAFSPDHLQRALRLTDFDVFAAQQKMMPTARPRQRPLDKPGQARQGAVLLLLYSNGNELFFPLTRRRDDLTYHAGQISLPGGRREDGEPLPATALREAQEEIGLDPTGVTILGALASIYIPPSDFEVHPFVAWQEGGRPSFTLQADEVAEIVETPLRHLFDPASHASEDWLLPGFAQPIQVPFYLVNGYKVWGATAIILSEFVERLRRVK